MDNNFGENNKKNDFLKGLQDFKKGAEDYIIDQLQNSHIGNYSDVDKEKREYLYNLVATILLEHNKEYKNTDIDIIGRFKSDESFKNKMLKRALKEDEKKPIQDMFGAKIVINNTKNFLPKSSILSQEREKNLELLSEFNDFKENKLIGNERKDLTSEEYFIQLKKLLKSIQSILPENAVNLIESYKKKEEIVSQKIDYLKIRKDKKIDNQDLCLDSKEFEFNDRRKSDFEYLLEDFEARIDDKVFYQILVNQIRTLLKNSELLKRFCIKIDSEKSKETENGYVAKFLKLDTLAGEIEIQLQTQNQYEEGVLGFASHMNYKYMLPPEPIPKDLDDIEKIREYRNKTKPKIPEFIKASKERSSKIPAVTISDESEYLALKEIYQVPDTSHLKNDLEDYFENVYLVRKKLFENPEQKIQSFQENDIEVYLNSEGFKHLKNIKERSIEEER